MGAQKQPLLTIGITCYNDEKFLEVCLESVVRQTYPHLEIIVVDDCSTDRSPAILADYGSRIRVIRHAQNSGSLTQGRIDVISSAKGDYIAHLDADDFLEPHFAERLMQEAVADPELDWIAPNLNVVDEAGNRKDQWDYLGFPSDPRAGLIRGFKRASVPVPKNGIFRTSFLRQNGLTWYELLHTRQGEDVLTAIKYLQHNPKIKLIPEFLLNYRIHDRNMSRAPEERVKMIIDLKEYYIDNLNELLYLFHPELMKLQYGSDEYQAFKYFMLTVEFLTERAEFRLPEIFRNGKTEDRTEECLRLFDEPIRRYAEKSLSYSRTHEKELRRILDFLAPLAEPPAETGGQSFASLASLGEKKFLEGDFDLADRYTSAALQMKPSDIGCLNNAGVIAFNRGDYSRSETMLRRALSLQPDLEDTHLNLCSLWGKKVNFSPPDASKARDVLKSVHWLGANAPDPSRRELMVVNHSLRDQVLEQYKNKYAETQARLLLHRPGNGALKYLMDNWRDVLNHMGIPTETMDWGADNREAFKRFGPTTFVTVADPSYLEQLDLAFVEQYRREHHLSVGHISTFEHRYEPCDFLITFHLDPSRDEVMRKAHLPLLSLPFGINPIEHYMRPGPEVWDFFFVGTNSPFKMDETRAYLQPILENYSGLLAGTNWPTGLGELPIKDSVYFYQSARIYPNFHVKRQMREFNELNDRTYIIPACGGFELVDNPVALHELFTPDEMAVAESPSAYREMFDHFLHHPEERRRYILSGMRRVYSEYTLFHTLDRLAAHLEIQPATPNEPTLA